MKRPEYTGSMTMFAQECEKYADFIEAENKKLKTELELLEGDKLELWANVGKLEAENKELITEEKRHLLICSNMLLKCKGLEAENKELKEGVKILSDALFELMNHCENENFIDCDEKTDGVKTYDSAIAVSIKLLNK